MIWTTLLLAAGLLQTGPPPRFDTTTSKAMFEMAQCESLQCLDKIKSTAPKNKFVELGYCSERLRFSEQDEGARRGLILNLPQTDDEFSTFYLLSTPPADWITDDQSAWGHVETFYESHFTRALETAISREPDLMDRFVRYGLVAVGDVHSSYPGVAAKTCKVHKQQFRKAVSELPAKERAWYASTIVNPKKCNALRGEDEE